MNELLKIIFMLDICILDMFRILNNIIINFQLKKEQKSIYILISQK